ncbi:oligomeric golgi complex component, COG2-domain-containing protein [Tirmania nivea]|nr:oligomeric golgi complex component, COG2-domain-containing protein [Tirmania nivea]
MSNFFLGGSTPTTHSLSRTHSPYDSRPVSPTTPTPFTLPPTYSSDSEDSDSLPFPQPLSRSSFSPLTAPHFSPHEFLASLHNRHQTLEDLRLELRNRSRDLERELVELVEGEYADFVGLGRSLKGGEGKVEDLRVGLWEFRREVEGLVGRVQGVEGEVRRGLAERRRVRGEKEMVRKLLGVARRLDDLEVLLLLEKEVDKFLCLKYAIERIPEGMAEGHPFMQTQIGRVERVRRTILVDLGTELRAAAVRGEEELIIEGGEERRKGKAVELMGLLLKMGEGGEAVRILKEVKGDGVDKGKVGARGAQQGSLRMK